MFRDPRFLVAALVGCAPTGQAGGRADWLSRCHVDGFDAETLCGELAVPIDPAQPTGPTLSLRVVVVPAVRPAPEPDPLVLLAGGPGQAATEAYGALLPVFHRIQQRRDLVFVDQRGTGSSSPLDCAPRPEDDLLVRRLSDTLPLDEIIECRDVLVESGPPLEHVTTAAATADLDRVRAALGVETWNLYGASYGTRAALDYASVYPEHVRSLVLDGVAPRSLTLFADFAVDGQAALDALLADCAKDPGCAEAFPALPRQLDTLLARDASSEPVTVRHPRTAATETLPLPGTVVAGVLRSVLYSPTLAALLPLAIDAAVPLTDSPPDFGPLVALSGSVGGDPLDPSLSLGMMLSVACHEDVPFISEDHVTQSASTFLGSGLIEDARQMCDVWAVPALDAPLPPVSFGGSALLLSGALDPVTPPRWGDQAAATLDQSQHIVVPGAGHNVAPVGCVPERVAAFIDDPETPVDDACATQIQRPPFVLDSAGPPG